MNLLLSYILFREYCPEEVLIEANSAMAACSVRNDAVVVNGVQDQGFTPLEEFFPRSAPKTVLTTAVQVC